MKTISVLILAVTFYMVDSFSTLDATNTKVIDSFLCTHLKVQTLTKVNASIIEKNRIEDQCITQINHTVDECIACMNSCGAQVTVPIQNTQSSHHSSHLDTALTAVLLGLSTGSLSTTLDVILGLGVDHLAHEIGHGVEHLGKELEHGVDHLALEISHGAEHLAHEIGHGVDHLAHEIGHGAEHLAHEIGHGLEHVGHEIEHGVHHLGHEIHHILGKKSANCDGDCPMCQKVKSSDVSIIELAVCGSAFVSRIKAIESLVPKFQHVTSALKQGNIIQKVEYDPLSLDSSGGSVKFGTVYVTANINGLPQRFQTTAPYQMMDAEASAAQWAVQILNLFLI